MPALNRADSQTFGPTTFTEQLAALRLQATLAGDAADPSNAVVLSWIQGEQLSIGGSSVLYQYIGDDANGYPVYRLGTLILLKNVKTQLDALVAAGSITQTPGADFAYSANPHIRK